MRCVCVCGGGGGGGGVWGFGGWPNTFARNTSRYARIILQSTLPGSYMINTISSNNAGWKPIGFCDCNFYSLGVVDRVNQVGKNYLELWKVWTPLTAKLINFHPLYGLTLWRVHNLHVSSEWKLFRYDKPVFNDFKFCWLVSRFVFNMFKFWYLMC